MRRGVRASYTIEAAGVMAAVFLAVMVLLNQAFHIRSETVGNFVVHEAVERERHKIENQDELEITRQAQGMRWSIELTTPEYWKIGVSRQRKFAD